MSTQKIIPHLWFDKEAAEAAEFYTKAFPNSKITSTTTLHDTPSGDTPVVAFELNGYGFMAISAGPLFTFNPSVSFILNFDPSHDTQAQSKLDELWGTLTGGGKVLMPLQEYPFSKRYGWVQDKYGISWQLILSDSEGEDRPFITPALMFVDDNYGKAEEAIQFYQSVFKDTRAGITARYGAGQEPDKPGNVMFADFMLENQWFAAMDSARMHGFTFNEAISLIVNCADQEEIDYYWEKLSAVPESEQCGWLKDKYGLSWQIVPSAMNDMMAHSSPEQIDRLTKAFLPMKKLDLATLEKAYKGDQE
ncbi:MAG TPA: VOC family protein [Candidatus Saccharimonadales bacterium]|nr:VOC family protein [Candidatus Saccharimonadales bacterium]